MANVMFKRGTQAALKPYLTSGAVEGTFYLTSDTNRLYVGNADGVAVPVNQGILSVGSFDALKSLGGNTGEFYYIEGSNILCVRSGDQWVQINPDTDTAIDSRKMSGNKDAETGFVTVSDVIVQKDNQGGEGESFTSEFSVKGENGITVDVNDNNGKPQLIIKQAAYAFSTAVVNEKDAKITIGDGSASSDITLKAGDNVGLAVDAANKAITVSAVDTTLDSAKLELVDGGKLKVTVGDTAENFKSGEVALTLNYGNSNNASTHTAEFKDNAFYFDVYTAGQIDAKFRTLDAMTYCGVTSDVPNGPHHLGDTYKVNASFEINGEKLKVGDLIIANGSEGTDGTITSVTWDIIPSANDSMTDTTYLVKDIAHGMQVVEAESLNAVGGLKLAANEYLTLTDVVADAGNDNEGKLNTVTVSHNEKFDAVGSTVSNATKEQSAENAFEFEIPVLGYDKAGHITSVSTEKIKVTDTVHAYGLSGFAVSASNGKASFSTELSSETAGVFDTASFSLSSSSLALKADKDDAKNIIVDIEWGSF